MAFQRTDEMEFAFNPFVLHVPTVSTDDVLTGGLHAGNARGVPCAPFGAVHGSYALRETPHEVGRQGSRVSDVVLPASGLDPGVRAV